MTCCVSSSLIVFTVAEHCDRVKLAGADWIAGSLFAWPNAVEIADGATVMPRYDQ